MGKISIDLRFVDVLYELSAIQWYIASFEGQLPSIVKQEEEKAYSRIREERLSADDGEVNLIRQELYDLTENVLPRFFRNAIIVTLWSIFESGVIDVAKELQSLQGKALSIDDLKGDFLERTKKYFHHVLNFPLNVSGKEWQRINMLRIMRNAIAHCNGRVENIVKDKDLKDLKKVEKQKVGVTIETGNLMFSKTFMQETYDCINGFLTNLIAEAKRVGRT